MNEKYEACKSGWQSYNNVGGNLVTDQLLKVSLIFSFHITTSSFCWFFLMKNIFVACSRE